MNADSQVIVGAGLAGLIAAHAWPNSEIFEASQQPSTNHRALLRFRTDAVARVTGIEFRKVRVHKGIWSEGGYHGPNIRLANLYAQKVLGDGQLRGERSIWSIEAVDRFVAPDDFYEQLVEAVGHRVRWGQKVDWCAPNTTFISTAPLPVTAEAFSLPHSRMMDFKRSPIMVFRCELPYADVFQTVYFPDPSVGVYRASITGRTLIIESMWPTLSADCAQQIGKALGISLSDLTFDRVEQKYGKIAPIDETLRKQLLFRLTHECRVYSLGRFATWRNILLDDVVDDIAAIKRLLKANNPYDTKRAMV